MVFGEKSESVFTIQNVWLKHRKIGAFGFLQYLSAGRDLSGKKGGCKFEGESYRTAATYVIKERTTAIRRPLQLFPPKFSGIFAGMFEKLHLSVNSFRTPLKSMF